MSNADKLNFIVENMMRMGETGYMKNVSYILVNSYVREILADEGIVPSELAKRIKKGLFRAGATCKFDRKIVKQLMLNADSLRYIKDY